MTAPGWTLTTLGLLVQEIEPSPDQIAAGFIKVCDVRKGVRHVENVTVLPVTVRVVLRRRAEAGDDGYPKWVCNACVGDPCEHVVAALSTMGPNPAPDDRMVA